MYLVFAVFLGLLIAGMPVGFAVGVSGVLFFFQHPELPLNQIVQLALTQVQSMAFLAVPLFILAGNLMNASGITERLLSLAGVLTGHMRGGMAQTSVVMSTLMGGISGSSTADAAMEAKVLGPTMLANGYPRGYTAVVIGFTSLITSTIPPGINLIIYGTTGNVSIGRLFMAGFVVGLIMMLFLMITVAITARVRGFKPARDKKATIREIAASIRTSIWAAIFPLLLLFGIRFGMFTTTEVGAFACIYAFFVGVCIYKEITLSNIYEILRTSAVDIGGIMFLIACTGIFSYGIPIDKIPQTITGFMLGMTENPTLILIQIIIALFLFGMFMDGGIVVLLTTPIFLPLILKIGVDPVFFGLILCTICCLGILTPPVGVAMYVVCDILKVPLKEWVRESVPFIAVVMLEIACILAFPEVVVFLPNLLFG